MPAIKKITDQIAEDMRAKYGAGESTQAELADLFNVSVPTVNKTVKGVKPAKRKYKVNPAKAIRDESIVAEYDLDAGIGMKELAAKYEMTHQNVSLILQAAGVNPRQEYFGRLRVQGAVRKEQVAAEAQGKRDAKVQKVQDLAALWQTGCKVEEFRVAAGLKSVNAAQVKIVHLRKKYGDEMFPRRNTRIIIDPADKQAKVEELSAIYLADPKNTAALAAVFGDKESSVQSRICSLRKDLENGEAMFPCRRAKRNTSYVSVETEEEKELEKESAIIEEVVSEVGLAFAAEEVVSEVGLVFAAEGVVEEAE